jgi:hypothetical protein
MSCGSQKSSEIKTLKLDPKVVDRIKANADSVEVEEINGEDFSTMHTYFQYDTNISHRVLQDSLGNITAIILMKDGHYLQSNQYYSNGQQKGKLSYEAPGVLDGPAIYFYEDGRIRTKGTFDHNNRIGNWKYFDEDGRLQYIEVYDHNGQLQETLEK